MAGMWIGMIGDTKDPAIEVDILGATTIPKQIDQWPVNSGKSTYSKGINFVSLAHMYFSIRNPGGGAFSLEALMFFFEGLSLNTDEGTLATGGLATWTAGCF